jgi:hypothetical protein
MQLYANDWQTTATFFLAFMIEAVNIYSEKYGDASNEKSPLEEEDYECSDPGILARIDLVLPISLHVFPIAS